MSLGSRLNRLERAASDMVTADPADEDWRVEVSRWASAFAGVFGDTPGEFPPSPEGHDPQHWRDAVEARACVEGWDVRALPIDATLPGMSPGALTIAAVALWNRWDWGERMRVMTAYKNDPRPWFVPADEPTLPEVSEEEWHAFALAMSVVSFYFPSKADHATGMADHADMEWWLARGVRPAHAHGVEIGYHPNFPERPQWTRLKALPDALPFGEVDPEWFW